MIEFTTTHLIKSRTLPDGTDESYDQLLTQKKKMLDPKGNFEGIQASSIVEVHYATGRSIFKCYKMGAEEARKVQHYAQDHRCGAIFYGALQIGLGLTQCVRATCTRGKYPLEGIRQTELGVGYILSALSLLKIPEYDRSNRRTVVDRKFRD